MTYSILLSLKHLQNLMGIAAAICIIVALAAPKLGRRFFSAFNRRFDRVARRRGLAIVMAAAFPMLARVALLPVYPFPTPVVHDEFSYLLLGDTFAHGRPANPTPPEWRHFETEYVLLKPAYASQYQPGQGLFLAAGEVLAGHPWWGVWLSMGIMFASICWALRQTLPARWALFGAAIAAMQFGIFGFWMNSYFGGAVAAAGGALVVGALLRMRLRPVASGAICGLGLVILFASRPFEGILWTIAAILFAALHVGSWRVGSWRAVPSCAIVCLVGAVLLAGYNERVTGDPLLPPYQLYRERYGTPQSYWWQPPVLVDHFDFPELRGNYENQLAYWRRRTSPALLWASTWHRLRDFWRFFLGPFFVPALLFAGYLWRDRRIRPWIFISALLILDHATYHAWYPQQAAASTVLIVLMMTQCWRRMRVWQRRRGFGLAMSRNLVAGFALCLVVLAVGRASEARLPPAFHNIWASLFPATSARERALKRLYSIPGKHLVFVEYSKKHPYYDEWVFNGADIPNQRVVFARVFTPESDAALARDLGDRDVWLARPDQNEMVEIRPALASLPLPKLYFAEKRHVGMIVRWN